MLCSPRMPSRLFSIRFVSAGGRCSDQSTDARPDQGIRKRQRRTLTDYRQSIVEDPKTRPVVLLEEDSSDALKVARHDVKILNLG